MNISIAERAQHVARMRANFALEGLHADATDLALQEAYISGETTLSELLAYAQAFALVYASDHAPRCDRELGSI